MPISRRSIIVLVTEFICPITEQDGTQFMMATILVSRILNKRLRSVGEATRRLRKLLSARRSDAAMPGKRPPFRPCSRKYGASAVRI